MTRETVASIVKNVGIARFSHTKLAIWDKIERFSCEEFAMVQKVDLCSFEIAQFGKNGCI